ncbi:MAG TPA: hypothetical protein VGF25_23680 [Thermoleophilaceae bacterium]|jgi:hypothetical protein
MRTFAISIIVAATLAVAATGAHAARYEYRTPAEPRAQGASCPKGFVTGRIDDTRCFRKCRDGFELLVHTAGGARGPAFCVPARDSKLWYRVRLEATELEESETGKVSSLETHSWTFTSLGATLLFRQCSVVDTPLEPDDARVLHGVSSRIPCRRQERALGVELLEDASFATNGKLVGGPYRFTETGRTPPSTSWIDSHGRRKSRPCGPPPNVSGVNAAKVKGSGFIATSDRSALIGGLDVRSSAFGPVTYVTQAILCPPPDPDAQPDSIVIPNRPAVVETKVRGYAVGTQLGTEMKLDLGSKFGRRRIVEEEPLSQTVGGTLTRFGKFKLVLVKCRKQRLLEGDACRAA